LEEPDDPFLPQRNQLFFALYTIASSIYKWVILFGILFFLYKVLEPYDLKIVSQILAIISMSSLVVVPVYKTAKFFYVPGRLHQVKRKNVYTTLGILAAVVAFVFFVPLPYRVVSPLELKPLEAEPVYVHVPGILEEILVKEGQKVDKDQTLGRLRSAELELDINELHRCCATSSSTSPTRRPPWRCRRSSNRSRLPGLSWRGGWKTAGTWSCWRRPAARSWPRPPPPSRKASIVASCPPGAARPCSRKTWARSSSRLRSTVKLAIPANGKLIS
jgi:hypothetical protein